MNSSIIESPIEHMDITTARAILAVADEWSAADRALPKMPSGLLLGARAGIERAALKRAAQIAIDAGYAEEPADDAALTADQSVDAYFRLIERIGGISIAAARVAVIAQLMPADIDI